MLIMMVTFAMVMLTVMDCFVRAVKSLSLLRYLDVCVHVAVTVDPNLLVVYGDLARIAHRDI